VQGLQKSFNEALALQDLAALTAKPSNMAPPPAEDGKEVQAKVKKLGFFLTVPQAVVGDKLSLSFEEPQFRIMAQEAWSRNDRFFLFLSSIPEPGKTATLIRMDTFRFDVDGFTKTNATAVDSCLILNTSKSKDKGGLFYANVRSWYFGEEEQSKGCCVLQ